MDDDKPPVETESKETPENPTPETPSTEVKETASEHHEEMPEWGKKLTDTIDSLVGTVNALLEAPSVSQPEPDESPAPKPWHKRGFGN